MKLLNEEYDKRKKICDKLFDIYKTITFYGQIKVTPVLQ